MNDHTLTGISDELYCAMQSQLQQTLTDLKKALIDCPYANEAGFVESFKVAVRTYKRQQRHHDQITSLLNKMVNASSYESQLILRRSTAQLQANAKLQALYSAPSHYPGKFQYVALEQDEPKVDPNDTPGITSL